MDSSMSLYFSSLKYANILNMQTRGISKTLYVLTHTETYDNKHRIFSGWRDSALTGLGHRQAGVQAKKLKKSHIDAAFVSPLKRTRQTLKHILKYHPGIKIYTDKRLIERHYGKLEGKSKPKYKFKYPDLYPIYHRSYETPPPGGESMLGVEKRVLQFLREVLAMMKKQKVSAVIVGHNNSIRPIRKFFEKLTAKQIMATDNRHKIFRYKIRL